MNRIDVLNSLKKIMPIEYYLVLRKYLLPVRGVFYYCLAIFLYCPAFVYMFLQNRRAYSFIFPMFSQRIGHLALNTELCFRRIPDDKKCKVFLFVEGDVANHYLLKKWGEYGIVVDKRCYLKFYLLRSLIVLGSRYVRQIDLHNNEFLEWKEKTSIFHFSEEEKKYGEKILSDIGIMPSDWFVCIFARDKAYLDTTYPGYCDDQERAWAYHDYRDSDIETLNLAIQEIIDRGGWVIRLGKVVAKEMTFKHPRVIDYPFSKWRSDFMDIYLQYRAKFILSSSTSGATDVSAIFGTPYCGVNMPYNWNVAYKNAIHIPQKFVRQEEYVGLRDWIEIVNKGNKSDYASTSFYEKCALRIENNSPEEILDLTLEMFERLDGKFIESQEDRMRQAKYLEIYKNYTDFSECKNPIGRQFLRNNPWYLE